MINLRWIWKAGTVLGIPLALYWIAATLARPMKTWPVFRYLPQPPLVIAHRGGSGLWPENTLYAFQRAAEMGVDMVEMDVHASADGVLVVMHDETVDRTTDGSGALKEMSLHDIQQLDAGYRWSEDSQSYPYRGQGITVPTLEEVFAALPTMPMTIEIKQGTPSITRELCRLIQQYNKQDMVIVGSFDETALAEFRQHCPSVATSAHAGEVRTFVYLNFAHLTRIWSPQTQAFQVPVEFGDTRIVTPQFVRNAHARGLGVQVWTVNETAEMAQLLDMGVDGLISDRPDRLLAYLSR